MLLAQQLGGPSLVYLALYQLTFAAHVVVAQYVCLGSGWLALRGTAGLCTGRPADGDIEATLRDWLPFALGLAITLGVAPLLFVQLVDGPAFYTANLLLSHRFMAILPALIAGFYLLYLAKARYAWVRRPWARAAIPLAAFGCFAFTASAWSENHLLALDRASWPAVYGGGPGFHWSPALLPRLCVFAGIGLVTVGNALALQLRWRLDGPAEVRAARTLLMSVVLGAVLTGVGFLTYPALPAGLEATGGVAVALGALGLIVAVWLVDGRRVLLRRRSVPVVCVAFAVLIEGTVHLRALIQLAGQDLARLGARHEAIWRDEGLWLFAVVLGAVLAVVSWAVRTVRREASLIPPVRREPDAGP